MELKILGSVAPYCKNGKNCPGYFIKEGKDKILLDCGNGITNYLNMEEDLENLTIFISHFHPDHYGDLSSIGDAADLFYKFGFLDNPVKLYLPKVEEKLIRCQGNTEYFVEKTEKVKEAEKKNESYVKDISDCHYFQTQEYNHTTNLSIGNMKISFCQTLHPMTTYALKVESPTGVIAYSADTGYYHKLTSFFQNSNLLLCEASLLKGQVRNDGHLYAYEAAELASKSHVEQLLLTHFWPEIGKEEYVREAQEHFQEVEAAQEGKVYQLTK